MTQVSIPMGFKYPWLYGPLNATLGNSGYNMTATGHKIAYIGYCSIEGRASSKVLSTAGGSISFLPNTGAVFANAGTNIDVGIQDVDLTTGMLMRPDGTYDVKGNLVGGTDTIVANTWKTAAMETGSKTISHGQLIAVVLTMVAKAGSDTLDLANMFVVTTAGGSAGGVPATVGFQTIWDYSAALPNIVITFDDGTLGTLDTSLVLSATAEDIFSNSTNPNERGIIFQVPWNCKIDGLYALYSANATTSDMAWDVYSTPLGTPATAIAGPITVAAELGTGAGISVIRYVTLPTEYSLTKGVDYCFAIKVTGAGAIELRNYTLPNENIRKLYPGSTTLKKATRNGATAFTVENPAVTMFVMGVRISSFEDSASGGAAGAGLARVHGGF